MVAIISSLTFTSCSKKTTAAGGASATPVLRSMGSNSLMTLAQLAQGSEKIARKLYSNPSFIAKFKCYF